MSQKEKKSTTRRKTIGQSPLDSLLMTSMPEASRRRERRRSPKDASTTEGSRPTADKLKVRATFHLPAELVDECRNAVVWLAGPPARLTMARLAEEALRRELDRLRKQHTKGKPFPKRSDDLRGGRPIGS